VSLDAIFKAYDIRGVYPDEIDEAIARLVGNAFARFTGAARVLVARDMRPSSVPLSEAFAEGANLAGADVTLLGLASTDLAYFASGRLDAPAAMFTASHNPAQYNGIKLCRAGAAPVGEETGLRQIRATVESGVVERAEAVEDRFEHKRRHEHEQEDEQRRPEQRDQRPPGGKRVPRAQQRDHCGGGEDRADHESLHVVERPPAERLRREAPPALAQKAAPEGERQPHGVQNRQDEHREEEGPCPPGAGRRVEQLVAKPTECK
jgi:hypothetical protein